MTAADVQRRHEWSHLFCSAATANSPRISYLLPGSADTQRHTHTVQLAALTLWKYSCALKMPGTGYAVRDTFLIDPAVILIVAGVVMFFITFCGCIGALRENIRLLKTTRGALGKFVKKAIVHYRDDLDLQNLMDYIQKEFKCCGWNNYTDWSWNLYFNCSQENPSSERCAVPYSCCTPVPGEVCDFFVWSLTCRQTYS
ncbi:Tetraspanin-33 [Liparis tanakae]|uniref:Tetraspanin-33 n=1 Tax=Liparis tanakae TaxID=230148 RepID=A0A4Z2G7Q3_9TELE|nr:Tetraspanin-33 [Liparis tanakae]